MRLLYGQLRHSMQNIKICKKAHLIWHKSFLSKSMSTFNHLNVNSDVKVTPTFFYSYHSTVFYNLFMDLSNWHPPLSGNLCTFFAVKLLKIFCRVWIRTLGGGLFFLKSILCYFLLLFGITLCILID